ncbi:barstar family protein [Amycolatopsis sp. BJA-103]|uniref:barstar family protein n=1 Tax=unclassified Amycolatopsis TaxID=2618356 RepID=UPI000C7813A3|nr:barstar family protein [Amycolatopsis sp. BJA-103]AUI57159.1 barnase inhibitor [Amycolatopsis sp. BJA-103]PNE15436.1 barnase inhibitor [Amycolatopsis sp. BJA-103]
MSAAKDAADKAFTRGAHPHLIDGGRTVDKATTLDAIAEALSFPDYFGKNLDALYDCLTDLSWLPTGEHVLIWSGSSVLKDRDPKAYLAVRSVLSDAQRALGPTGDRSDSRRLTVVLPD